MAATLKLGCLNVADVDFEVVNVPVRCGKNHVNRDGFSTFQAQRVTAPEWVALVKSSYKVSCVIIHVHVYTYNTVANAYLQELDDFLYSVVIPDCCVYYNRRNTFTFVIAAIRREAYVGIIVP